MKGPGHNSDYNYHSEAMAHAREEAKRVEELNEQGLCLDCASNPQNPHLSGRVCLSCWDDTPHMGCDVSGCPNSTDGHFRQAGLCEIHLADTIHKMYDEYLTNKDELETEKERLKTWADSVDVELHNSSYGNYREMTDEQQDVIDEWAALRHRERGIHQLKNDIKKAMDQIEEPFPDEYEVLG